MRHPDAAWHERMYNNRALVPEFADHLAQWRALSQQARAQGPCVLDVAYGDGPLDRLDIFPAAQPNAPVAVFIHGGYWRSLDKADHSFVAPVLQQRGVCVVVIDYELCPGSATRAVTIADIALQCARALAWVWRNIGRYGGDAQRISAFGHSAGGHLVAMLLACRWPLLGADLPPDLLRRALSISGLFDLQPIRRTPFLQADLRLSPAAARRCSPALWPAPSERELWSVVGGLESAEFLRHNQLIAQAWGPQVVPVCEALPGLNHFTVLSALNSPQHRLAQLLAKLALA